MPDNAVINAFGLLILTVLISIGFATIGLLLVRRWVNHEKLVGHHDVAGYFISVIGSLYAVVLGFIVVYSLNAFQGARLIVDQEANALHDFFHVSVGLPSELSHNIRTTCIEYTDVVINEEWTEMEHRKFSHHAHLLIAKLWSLVVKFKPTNPGEQNIQAAMLQQLQSICDARHIRLLAARTKFDPLVGFVLLASGTIVVVFTYFFSVRSIRVQLAMTALITTILALNLVLIYIFSYPFGDLKITPQPFIADLLLFKAEIRGEKLPP